MRRGRDDNLHDHYALLGVDRAADDTQLRRAFHTLAMRHHPDRAGPGSTEVFQRITEAYAVLSDAETRAHYDARYDAHLRTRRTTPVGRAPHAGRPAAGSGAGGDGPVDHRGQYEGPGGSIGWQVRKTATVSATLLRVSGALEALVAQGIARRLEDGVIELKLTADESATGGVITIDAAVSVTCPTCTGLAQPDVLWCCRCDHAGTVIDHVTFTLQVPPGAHPGLSFSFVTDPRTPPFRVRLRIG